MKKDAFKMSIFILLVGGFITNFGKIAGTVGKGITAIGNFGKTAKSVITVFMDFKKGTQALNELAKTSKIAAVAQKALAAAFELTAYL